MTNRETRIPCPRCGPVEWRRERGPDCVYAVCPRCGMGYDVGWGPNERYFAAAPPPVGRVGRDQPKEPGQ